MKLNLKLITSSFILALTFLAPQVTYASDEQGFNDNKVLVVASSSTTTDVVLATPVTTISDVVKHLCDEGTGPADPRFQSLVPEIMRMIFERASNIGAKPVALSFVCKNWHMSMRENQPVDVKLQYGDMNNFMKNCMRRYWAHPIRNIELTHTDPKTDKKTVMNIPADADLLKFVFESKNPNISKKVRITTSVDEFFKVKGENEDKLVILVCTYAVIKNLHAASLCGIIEKWDSGDAPVGLFWRWGNWESPSWYDYLVTSSASDLSDVNLFEHWKKSEANGPLPHVKEHAYEYDFMFHF